MSKLGVKGEFSENYLLYLRLTVFPAAMFIALIRKEFMLKILSHLNCLHPFSERFSSSRPFQLAC